jgi:TetR/AcrR family transcriptional regulator, mexJK operon transcriptional repressor
VSEAIPVRRGGRPTRLEASQLGDKILAAATELFLTRGFGATSVEAVAARARISKRTFYHRFRDKTDLFRAAIDSLIRHWLPQIEAEFEVPAPAADVLTRLARRMLALALQPQALALRRLLLAEAERFPELVAIVIEQGAARGVERIAVLLEAENRAGRLEIDDSRFAATQFQEMVLAIPLRRAMGFGLPLSEAELDLWARRCVALFLHGCGKPSPAALSPSMSAPALPVMQAAARAGTAAGSA